jgi:hypothetical protein
MPIDLKSYVRGEIEQARDLYLKDIAALSDVALATSPGGVARTPYNFTYEIVVINKRFATRLRGEDPGAFDPTAWATVPDEFQNRDKMTAEFTDSMNSVLAALEAIPGEEMDREIPTGSGTTSPFDLGLFCATHTGYHGAQLNYIQALNGDAEMHWH